MKTKRTEITIETSRLLVVNKPKRVIASCEQCGTDVIWGATDEAAILSRVRSKTIFQQAEKGHLHSLESTEGLLLICLNSLMVKLP